jgi:hypothetical protein
MQKRCHDVLNQARIRAMPELDELQDVFEGRWPFCAKQNNWRIHYT